jgi:hypothetical protein
LFTQACLSWQAVVDAGTGFLEEWAEHAARPKMGKLANSLHFSLPAFLPLVDAGSVKPRSMTRSLADQPWLLVSLLLGRFAPVRVLLLFAKHLLIAARKRSRRPNVPSRLADPERPATAARFLPGMGLRFRFTVPNFPIAQPAR